MLDLVGPLGNTAVLIIILLWVLSQWRVRRNHKNNPGDGAKLQEILSSVEGLAGRMDRLSTFIRAGEIHMTAEDMRWEEIQRTLQRMESKQR